MWRLSGVCSSSIQWKREWLQVTPVWGATPEDQNLKSFGAFGAGSHEGRGDRSGQTSPRLLWGAESALCVQGVGARRKWWRAEALRLSLEAEKHFPWEETAWRGSEGFNCMVEKHQPEKYRWPCPGADEFFLMSFPAFSVLSSYTARLCGFGMCLHPFHSPVVVRESKRSSSNSACGA